MTLPLQQTSSPTRSRSPSQSNLPAPVSEPNLVRVEFDDDAMAAAMREMAEPYHDDAEE
jgi:hypothetical protein